MQFAIYRGPTLLCLWESSESRLTFSEQARHHEHKLILGELDYTSLVIEPADEEREYRISIGDVPISDMMTHPAEASGITMLGRRVWGERAYFESARGDTPIAVDTRPRLCESLPWDCICRMMVYVVPTKVGEAAYEQMADDLMRISRSLLLDLYGKSNRTVDLTLAKRAHGFHSHEEELDAAAGIVDRLGPLVTAIERRPSAVMVRKWVRREYWGTERLDPASSRA